MSQAFVARARPSLGLSPKILWSRLETRMLLLAPLIAAVMSFASPYFLSTSNLLNLLDQSIEIGIVAVGMTFVVLTGGIDLSVGSVAGMTGVIFGLAVQSLSCRWPHCWRSWQVPEPDFSPASWWPDSDWPPSWLL